MLIVCKIQHETDARSNGNKNYAETQIKWVINWIINLEIDLIKLEIDFITPILPFEHNSYAAVGISGF